MSGFIEEGKHSQGVSVQDVEEPEIVQPTQVLIEVRAASLDPVDLKVFLI